jgi:hypothetical protein
MRQERTEVHKPYLLIQKILVQSVVQLRIGGFGIYLRLFEAVRPYISLLVAPVSCKAPRAQAAFLRASACGEVFKT